MTSCATGAGIQRMSARRISVYFAPIVLMVALEAVIFGCDDPVSHIYTARVFDSARGCLGPNLSIDILAGPNPGAGCEPICVIGRSSVIIGAPEAVYVSTMCAPHPLAFDITGKRPECVSALAAIRSSDSCAPDAGSDLLDAGQAVSVDAAAAPYDANAVDASGGTTPDATGGTASLDANGVVAVATP